MTAQHQIERSFVRTASGLRHIAQCGAGLPVVLLHQTPRSWDEYRDVLPLLAAHVRAIAMDTPGFGDSPGLDAPPSIEAWAAAVRDLLDALEIPQACIAGHHTGAVIALEAAARTPDRVAALVLSSCPMVDEDRRRHHAGKTPIDTASPEQDGGHLTRLWAQRQPFYPADATGLLDRYIIDALRAGVMAPEGHRVVNGYRMEDRIGLVQAPTLVIGATDDPHAFPATHRIARAIPGARVTLIPGGTVPLPDAMPAEFSAAILQFLRDIGLIA
jgi:pimeloyl-ACP methyl ester carboxylesterase